MTMKMPTINVDIDVKCQALTDLVAFLRESSHTQHELNRLTETVRDLTERLNTSGIKLHDATEKAQ